MDNGPRLSILGVSEISSKHSLVKIKQDRALFLCIQLNVTF
jgi:hypothetical protein